MCAYHTTKHAAQRILDILQLETPAIGATLKREKRKLTNHGVEETYSVKREGKTFRIHFQWVRDEYRHTAGHMLGTGYIETEYDLMLCPQGWPSSLEPPYEWRAYPTGQLAQGEALFVLDDEQLRRLINEKLSAQRP